MSVSPKAILSAITEFLPKLPQPQLDKLHIGSNFRGVSRHEDHQHGGISAFTTSQRQDIQPGTVHGI